MSELLPCPWCGHAPDVDSAYEHWMVQCNNDDCEVSCEVWHINKDLAIAAWNRRQLSPPPPEDKRDAFDEAFGRVLGDAEPYA